MMKTSIFSSNKLFKWGTIIGLAILAVVAVMFVLSALGFNRGFKEKETLTAEEAGTIESGTLNNGWIAETEEFVFYIDPDSGEMSPGPPEGNLIGRNRDWTGRMELTANPISYFTVSEEWIYYSDASDNDKSLSHEGGRVRKEFVVQKRYIPVRLGKMLFTIPLWTDCSEAIWMVQRKHSSSQKAERLPLSVTGFIMLMTSSPYPA